MNEIITGQAIISKDGHSKLKKLKLIVQRELEYIDKEKLVEVLIKQMKHVLKVYP